MAKREDKAKKAPRQPPGEETGRMMPATQVGEMGVVCAMMLQPEYVASLCVERKITGEMFNSPGLRTIYEVMLSQWHKKKPLDLVSVTQELADRDVLETVGGSARISELYTYLPTVLNTAHHLDLMEEKHVLREIVRICTEYHGAAYDSQDEFEAVLDNFEREVMAIRKTRHTKRANMRDLVMQVIGDFERAYEHRGQISGLSSGFDEYDQKTDGFQKGEMIVIAARPSMGKTAFALNIAEHVALTLGKAVGIFSLEMPAKQLVKRLMCTRAQVNWFQYRDGFIRSRDFPAITAAASQIADANIIVEDAAGQTIQEIRAAARRLKTEKNVEAIFVDYLQLVRSSSKRAQENRQQEVAEVSQGLKEIAKELGIPVIALAQIDRGVEKTAGKHAPRKPRLADLRESGSIEQDADAVTFIIREEMYAETLEEKAAVEGQATLSIAKSRNGPTGDVDLTFVKEHGRFESRLTSEQAEQPALPGADVKPQRRSRNQGPDD